MKYFRIVPVRDSTQQNKASNFSGKFRVVFRSIFRFEIKTFRGSFVLQTGCLKILGGGRFPLRGLFRGVVIMIHRASKVRMRVTHRCIAKRPASYRDPKPRNPKLLEKNSKITPRAPTPNSLKKNSKNTKNTRKTLEKYCFRVFLVFFEFFSRNLGSGPGGVIFEFFSRSFGFRGFGSL